MRVFDGLIRVTKSAMFALTGDYVTREFCGLKHDHIEKKLDRIDKAVNGADGEEGLKTRLARMDERLEVWMRENGR